MSSMKLYRLHVFDDIAAFNLCCRQKWFVPDRDCIKMLSTYYCRRSKIDKNVVDKNVLSQTKTNNGLRDCKKRLSMHYCRRITIDENVVDNFLCQMKTNNGLKDCKKEVVNALLSTNYNRRKCCRQFFVSDENE